MKYRDAADALAAWVAIAEQVRWANFVELRSSFPDADMVDGYVVFNIRRNRYRLITVVHFAKPERGTRGHIYVRSFLTHQAYNRRENRDRMYGS